MKITKHSMQRIVTEEHGVAALEYAVIISLIIIVAMTALSLFGNGLAAWFTGAAPTVEALQTN